MFFQTTVLLRSVVLLGFTVALVGFGLAGYYVFDYFTIDRPIPGYTSLAVLLLVLVGFTILCLGVVGLYVGKVFEQVKDRPLFLIDSEAMAEPDVQIADRIALEPAPVAALGREQ
jgi:hypothetical protein